MFCEPDMIDTCRSGHKNISLSSVEQLILLGLHFRLML